jgi:hypothetical protein
MVNELKPLIKDLENLRNECGTKLIEKLGTMLE